MTARPDSRSAARPRRIGPALALLAASALLLGPECGPATVDGDLDGIPDAYDNCRDVANPDQRNSVRSASEVCVGAVAVPDADADPPTAFAYGTCANDPGATCLSPLDCAVGDACDCDLDGNGRCNIDDFNLFLGDYAAGAPSGNGSDLSGDGAVDAADFALFEPLFAQGSGGPGPVLVEVVDAGDPGACYDKKWGRRLWASEGRIPSPNGILDCSVEGNALPIPEVVFDVLQIAEDVRAALEVDKNNPTDALLRQQLGVDVPICPNASFSIASKVEPRACDAHDLCLDHCGTKVEDCNLQFYRDLFNTCEALAGAERVGCHAACTTYAMLYATAIATEANGALTPILSPPADDDPDPPTDLDLERDLYNCQCRPALCTTTADCLAQSTKPRALACDRGYCVQNYRDVGCTEDAGCPDDYRCDEASGDCWFDVRGLPLLLDAPPPVCGDGVCQEGIESCQASACPEDCGDASAPLVAGDGRCGLGDACLLDRDCAEGACLHGSCQRLADGSVCSDPDECASDSCDFLTRHCKSGCLLDQDCGTGVCSVTLQCIPPQPNGSLCDAPSDCASGNCFAGVCTPVCGDDVCELPELCGAVNSGLECNADCGKCPNGTACASNGVCESGVCNAPICIEAGSVAPGGTCTTNGACSSGSCAAGFCAGSCGDGYCTVVPNAETCYANSCQADCGACPNGVPCTLNADCASGRCFGLVCSPQVFCGDFVCSPGETCASCGIDCGVCPFCGDFSCNAGETCATCAFDCGDCCAPQGNVCLVGSDCCSGSCSFFTCQ